MNSIGIDLPSTAYVKTSTRGVVVISLPRFEEIARQTVINAMEPETLEANTQRFLSWLKART